MDYGMKIMVPEPSQESLDLLSSAWCNSAIQVFQPKVDDCSLLFKEKQIVPIPSHERTASPIQKQDMGIMVDESGFKPTPQLKIDDLKSWIWLQRAIHPELDYDTCTRKNWLSSKLNWNGISIKKWYKEIKQKKKEKERLQRAQVQAAISVAGVAAALAAIAAENMEGKQQNRKEMAVASAAALVAAQCAQLAESVGAKREQLSSAINAAVTATDANNIITLTAAAATSLRGAAALKGRPGHRDKIKGSSPTLLINEHDFDYGRCRASLSKGEEVLVATEDGQCKLRSVSAVLNRNTQVILRIKKKIVLKTFSNENEFIVRELHTNPDDSTQDEDGYYCIDMNTNQGKVKLKLDEYVQYKEWIATINHMLMLSVTFSRQELQLYRD